ncbi:MAG: amidohydrolase [Chloroflexi bacterium]|nr:amidohydrolase [Chloroflexota bacterium]
MRQTTEQPTAATRSSQPEAGRPDLLLVNARVLTLERGKPAAEAVAVTGDTIAAVGRRDQVSLLAAPGARTIDCQGMTLLPGLIDAHCHLLATAASLRGVDCSPDAVSSIHDVQMALRRRVETTPEDRWIRGFGYDDVSLAEGRHPTRWDLDQAAPNHPVRLDHRSGHATVMNSLGLSMAGIGQDTPDPPQGLIDREPQTGEPTGLLLELAGWLRERLGHSGDEAGFQEGLYMLDRMLLSYGITSVQDAGPDNGLDRWRTLMSVQASGQLSCRVTMMAGASKLQELVSEGLTWHSGDGRLRLGHAKLMLTLTTGALHPNMEDLRDQVDQAHGMGFPVAIHAVEREAVEAAASVVSAGDRIEHCAECPAELVAQVRSTGATVVTQPGFLYWNGGRYIQRVDPELQPHLYPVGALHQAGVPLAFGSDSPVADPNPWPAIYGAVTRTTRDGTKFPPIAGMSATSQEVPVTAALRMQTIGGAHADGSEDRKGTISRGKLADLVLVDADPTEVEPDKLKDIRAVMTVIGGNVVWSNGL